MIHRFRVQNFKSIIDVSVDLTSVTVLVGKSGTGKSNFVEAIRTLRDLLSSQDNSNLRQQWPQVCPVTTPGATTNFEVDFSIVGIDEKFTYELSLGEHGPQNPPTKEILRLGDQVLFHQELNERAQATWISEPDLVEKLKPGRPAIGRIPSISDIVTAYTALATGIGCYTFPDRVLSHSFRDSDTMGLDDQATNYLSVLKEIVSNLQDLHIRKSIVATLQRVNSSVSSIELNNLQNPEHVVVGHDFEGKTLALKLAQESDGFRRFYAHLLALYQRPPKQTLLFEHPEDGIYPGALALLAEEFKAAAEDGRGQIILTTHSPKLLDHFDADQIRVVELDGFATRIGPISTEQHEAIQEDLMDAGELLTVDPARIESNAQESAGA